MGLRTQPLNFSSESMEKKARTLHLSTIIIRLPSHKDDVEDGSYEELCRLKFGNSYYKLKNDYAKHCVCMTSLKSVQINPI